MKTCLMVLYERILVMSIKLKLCPEGTQPCQANPYHLPKVHEETLKIKVDWLVSIGILICKTYLEKAGPTNITPKKNVIICFIYNFKAHNKKIRRQPFPIPKIKTFKSRRFQTHLFF